MIWSAMPGVDAVVFDLDGTLLDTLEDLAESLNAALEEAGYPPHPVSAYRYFVGDGARRLVERAFPPGRPPAEEEADRIYRNYLRHYGECWDRKSKPYPGILELLDLLRDLGIPLAVCSNKPDAFTRLCVERLLPPQRFAAVIGQREGVPRKPDPAAALLAARQMGVDPGACLFVGDSGVDMETACRAGMAPIGVLWGFREAGELLGAGARCLLASPAELEPLLGPR
ncbi:MAG TPA: HAD-IA family hydrolase [Verrucomicrobiales bacterium]|nr:HAD-IA family hydrolase [Verrucomicrobiales bacterium]